MERPTKARAVKMVKRMMMVDLEVEGGRWIVEDWRVVCCEISI